VLAYIVAWIVVPEEPRHPAPAAVAGEPGANVDADPAASVTPPEDTVDPGRTAMLVGGGLVLIGLWFLVREYLPDINWGLIWPLLLVAAGVVILVGASRRR
jgi:hypothetical protein